MTLLDSLRNRAIDEGLPLRVILKEALQVYALAALYGRPGTEPIVFQGGTCLRLIYDGPRYSEDLDFVTSLQPSGLAELFEPVHRELSRLASLFEGEVELRAQKESAALVRWRLAYRAVHQADSASVNLEFAVYPAYTSRAAPLNPPPDLPRLPLVIVQAETAEEIMADKITAIAGRGYVKGRDVFDLWLLKSRGLAPDWALVQKKLADYHVPAGRLRDASRLAAITPEAVGRELENFLPRQQRAVIREPALTALVGEVRALLEAAP